MTCAGMRRARMCCDGPAESREPAPWPTWLGTCLTRAPPLSIYLPPATASSPIRHRRSCAAFVALNGPKAVGIRQRTCEGADPRDPRDLYIHWTRRMSPTIYENQNEERSCSWFLEPGWMCGMSRRRGRSGELVSLKRGGEVTHLPFGFRAAQKTQWGQQTVLSGETARFLHVFAQSSQAGMAARGWPISEKVGAQLCCQATSPRATRVRHA